jgi:hypothetical protein
MFKAEWVTYANATRLFLSLTLSLLAAATPPLRTAVMGWIGATDAGHQITAHVPSAEHSSR